MDGRTDRLPLSAANAAKNIVETSVKYKLKVKYLLIFISDPPNLSHVFRSPGWNYDMDIPYPKGSVEIQSPNQTSGSNKSSVQVAQEYFFFNFVFLIFLCNRCF